MGKTLAEFGDIETFVANVNNGLAKCGISRGELSMLDHVCYRVETNERYNEMLRAFGEIGLLLDESEVSGRLIATYELEVPFKVGGWRIPYVELPQPKEKSPYPEGFEHAEFVVIGGLRRFADRHRRLELDDKGMTKPVNPELSLKRDGISVKFHEQQLGAVVRIEQRLAREATEEVRANGSVKEKI